MRSTHSAALVQLALQTSGDMQASLAADNSVHTYKDYRLDYEFQQHDQLVVRLGWLGDLLCLAYRSQMVRFVKIDRQDYKVVLQKQVSDSPGPLEDMVIGEQYLVFQIGQNTQVVTD